MGAQSVIHDLRTLICSHHPLLIAETSEEARLVECIRAAAHQLGLPVYEWSIIEGLKSSLDFQPLPRTQTPSDLLTALDKLSGEAVFLLKDFAPELQDRSINRKLREICDKFSQSKSSIIISGVNMELPAEIKALSVHFRMKFPSAKELGEVVKNVVQSLRKTAALKIEIDQAQLDKLLDSLRALTLNQARQIVTQAILEDHVLSKETVERVIDAKVKLMSDGGLLEYFPAEDNPHELGGFGKLKEWLDRSHQGFSKEAKALGLRAPRGVLLLGVPGCGKSLAAKYCARSWQLPLLKLDFSRLFDKYIGETEKNFFKAIEMAESMAPVVLWMDEIEKAIQMRSSGGEDSGLSQRLLGSLLSWMQEKKESVFVIATANDVSALPPELMRKGRFDEIFFVDLPSDSEREQIFSIHLKIRKQKIEAFDLKKLSLASEGFTGAEIEQAIVAALYESLHQKKELNMALILHELKSTKPLSESRREDIDRLRRFASESFVSVS